MRKLILAIVLFLSVILVIEARTYFKRVHKTKNPSAIFKSGDIIFQTNSGGQSLAIMLATHSKYTHVGLIYFEQGIPFVYEAVQPVKKTPLKEWISNGVDHHYVVKRLQKADSILTPSVLSKMKIVFYNHINKNYDLYFGWNDDRIYCSELVWKIYKGSTSLDIGKLQRLKDFDLQSQEVKTKLKERYGNQIPYEEVVVSPQSIFDCKLLTTVVSE